MVEFWQFLAASTEIEQQKLRESILFHNLVDIRWCVGTMPSFAANKRFTFMSGLILSYSATVCNLWLVEFLVVVWAHIILI